MGKHEIETLEGDSHGLKKVKHDLVKIVISTALKGAYFGSRDSATMIKI